MHHCNAYRIKFLGGLNSSNVFNVNDSPLYYAAEDSLQISSPQVRRDDVEEDLGEVQLPSSPTKVRII